jgi:hypothetical protein
MHRLFIGVETSAKDEHLPPIWGYAPSRELHRSLVPHEDTKELPRRLSQDAGSLSHYLLLPLPRPLLLLCVGLQHPDEDILHLGDGHYRLLDGELKPPNMHPFICSSICPRIGHISIHLSMYACIYMYVCMNLSIFLSIYYIQLSIYLSILSNYPSIPPSIHPPINPTINPTVHNHRASFGR